jgi:hypothetical protein
VAPFAAFLIEPIHQCFREACTCFGKVGVELFLELRARLTFPLGGGHPADDVNRVGKPGCE